MKQVLILLAFAYGVACDHLSHDEYPTVYPPPDYSSLYAPSNPSNIAYQVPYGSQAQASEHVQQYPVAPDGSMPPNGYPKKPLPRKFTEHMKELARATADGTKKAMLETRPALNHIKGDLIEAKDSIIHRQKPADGVNHSKPKPPKSPYAKGKTTSLKERILALRAKHAQKKTRGIEDKHDSIDFEPAVE